jgi:hypothetical protein
MFENYGIMVEHEYDIKINPKINDPWLFRLLWMNQFKE